jgi:DNA-binding transcriptional MocR family regulator
MIDAELAADVPAVLAQVAALRAVEHRGLAVARPQSGFFARPPRIEVAAPTTTRSMAVAHNVGVDSVMVQVIDASHVPSFAPFGAAAPDAELFPLRRLQRMLLSTAGRKCWANIRCPSTASSRCAASCCAAMPTSAAASPRTKSSSPTAVPRHSTWPCARVTRPGDTVAIESPVYLLQEVMAEILGSGGYERHLAKLRATYAQRVSQVAAAVLRYFPSGTRMTQPRGGFVIWVELPRGIDSLALFDSAIRHGVNFAPGPLFSATGRYRNFLRLNCGRRWTPALDAAVARLGRLAAKMHRT